MSRLNVNIVMKYSYYVVFTLLICTEYANSCFIRNCPPGGKRSLDIVSRAIVPVSMFYVIIY